MESPRGINDPCLGAFAEILAEADCILLLGKRLDFTLAFGKAPAFDPRCIFLQIDPESLRARSHAARSGRSRRREQRWRTSPPRSMRSTALGSAMREMRAPRSLASTRFVRRSPIGPPPGMARASDRARQAPSRRSVPAAAAAPRQPSGIGLRLRRRRIRTMGAGVPHAPHRVINGVAGIDRFGVAVRARRTPRAARGASRRAAGRRHVRFSRGGNRHGGSLRVAVRRSGRQRRALECRIPDSAQALRSRPADRLRASSVALRQCDRWRWAATAST